MDSVALFEMSGFPIVYAKPSADDLWCFVEQVQELIGYARWLQEKFPNIPLSELEVVYKKVSEECMCGKLVK